MAELECVAAGWGLVADMNALGRSRVEVYLRGQSRTASSAAFVAGHKNEPQKLPMKLTWQLV
jgi:hypothetical protein